MTGKEFAAMVAALPEAEQQTIRAIFRQVLEEHGS